VTAEERAVIVKILKNLSSYEVWYRGAGPDKRDEAFRLLKQVIRGGRYAKSDAGHTGKSRGLCARRTART
jgi:hypothetical protein